MEILGLIFSNIHNKEVFEATKVRTIASTPIGGRYRLIDFALSNMANAGIHQVGIITKANYESLMDHIGSGKEWDLARKKGGLVILPPYCFNDEVYTTRLEAIKCHMNYIIGAKCDYVIFTDCYHVCNVDYKAALEYHLEKGADITCIYHEHVIGHNDFSPAKVYTVEEDGRISKISMDPEYRGIGKAGIDSWIMKKSFLIELVNEAIQTNYKSFNRDILMRNLNNYKVYGFEHKGYFGYINNLKTYYDINMDLTKREVRNELFYQKLRPIYTKVRDSAPTQYGEDAVIENSIIADGCKIDGTVKNSVIFRGAKVNKGAVVENSILMQDTFVAENTTLKYVITDKNVKIQNKKDLVGDEEHLIYVNKGGIL